MMEIFERDYWSKSKNFLLPLTGVKKVPELDLRAYMKWGEYGVANGQLVVKVEYGAQWAVFQSFVQGLAANGRAFLTEAYHGEGVSVLIFDLSEWGEDLQRFIEGKYSQFSTAAKDLIRDYHIFYQDGKPLMNVTLKSCIYANDVAPEMDNLTPLEYAIRHYVIGERPTPMDFDTAKAWRKRGELCAAPDVDKETLVMDESQLGTPALVD